MTRQGGGQGHSLGAASASGGQPHQGMGASAARTGQGAGTRAGKLAWGASRRAGMAVRERKAGEAVAPAEALAETAADAGEDTGSAARLVGEGATEAPPSTRTAIQKATLSFIMPLYLLITHSARNPNG